LLRLFRFSFSLPHLFFITFFHSFLSLPFFIFLLLYFLPCFPPPFSVPSLRWTARQTKWLPVAVDRWLQCSVTAIKPTAF
jgi:hypothetical protein